MYGYHFRKATINDLSFLAEIVIAAEKSNSEKLSFAALMELSEKEIKDKIIAMFAEETDGCEFSASSYLLAVHNGQPVAGFGSWVEGATDDMPSKVLKSNLISYTFGAENIRKLQAKSDFIEDLFIEREKGVLQFEYLYVDRLYRGKGLADMIISEHIRSAKQQNSGLQKAQVQTYADNNPAIKLYQRNGFEIVKSVRAKSDETLLYLPYDEKVLLEKHI